MSFEVSTACYEGVAYSIEPPVELPLPPVKNHDGTEDLLRVLSHGLLYHRIDSAQSQGPTNTRDIYDVLASAAERAGTDPAQIGAEISAVTEGFAEIKPVAA